MTDGQNSIPTWAAPIISDTSYTRARVDTMAAELTAVKSEVDKLQATQVPIAEHSQLMSDVRQLRDNWHQVQGGQRVWKGMASFAAVSGAGSIAYAIAHFAGWIH